MTVSVIQSRLKYARPLVSPVGTTMFRSIRPRYAAAMIDTGQPQRSSLNEPSGIHPRARATIAAIIVRKNDR